MVNVVDKILRRKQKKMCLVCSACQKFVLRSAVPNGNIDCNHPEVPGGNYGPAVCCDLLSAGWGNKKLEQNQAVKSVAFSSGILGNKDEQESSNK